MSQKLFTELGLSPEILKAVEKMGFEQASPIQSEAIPPLLLGKDMIGQSQTGSGKTAAFGIPAIELVDASKAVPQVLILAPTRELASQVAEEIAKLATFKKGVRELPIYGGASYDRQFRGLRAGPQIVIGTPGRVLDHVNNKALDLSNIKMVVLDEADRMLDMGFRDDLDAILKTAPVERQTVLFSATLPDGIRRIIQEFTKDAVRVKIEATALTVPNIEQSYVDVDFRSKTEVLCRLLDVQDVKYGIVFCFTKIQVDEITDALNARGYNADKLHGDMSQMLRERVMKKFRDRKIELLIATDVAARGLDVDDLEIVFNYELPHDPEDYVHRIGRTGRAGKSGKAITLVSGREYGRLQQVMRFTKVQIPRTQIPRIDEMEQKQAGKLQVAIRETLDAGDYTQQDTIIEEMLKEHTANQIISAMMHLLSNEILRPVERIREDDPRGGPQGGADRRQPPAFREGPPPRGEFRDGPPREQRPQREFTGDVSRVNDQTGSWIRISVGRNAGVMPGDIVGCIAGQSGLPSEVIGRIEILPTVSLVQVSAEHAEQIISAIDGARLKSGRIGASVGSPPAQQFDRRGGPPPRRFEGGDQGGPPRRSFGSGFGPGGGGPFRRGVGGAAGGGGGYGGPPRPVRRQPDEGFRGGPPEPRKPRDWGAAGFDDNE